MNVTFIDGERGRAFRPGLTVAEKARFFATARSGAYQGRWGDDLATAVSGWKPTLGGLIVVNKDDPRTGYAQRSDALDAARRFKRGAARYLALAGEAGTAGTTKIDPVHEHATRQGNAQRPPQ